MAHVPVEPAGSPSLSSRLNGQRQADGVRGLRLLRATRPPAAHCGRSRRESLGRAPHPAFKRCIQRLIGWKKGRKVRPFKRWPRRQR
jgi:hypothetical protein